MKEESITISKEYYEELKRDEAFLQCLYNAGVDNTEAYDYAQDLFEREYPEYYQED